MSKTKTAPRREIRINIASLPPRTRKYILELSAQKNISPNAAAELVLNYAANLN